MTLRQHLEAIRELPGNSMLTAQEKLAFAEDRAVAALKALDEAPSYEDIVFYGDMADFLGNSPIRARLVPDPAPPTENT